MRKAGVLPLKIRRTAGDRDIPRINTLFQKDRHA